MIGAEAIRNPDHGSAEDARAAAQEIEAEATTELKPKKLAKRSR
jgi:hypothetical protein